MLLFLNIIMLDELNFYDGVCGYFLFGMSRCHAFLKDYGFFRKFPVLADVLITFITRHLTTPICLLINELSHMGGLVL